MVLQLGTVAALPKDLDSVLSIRMVAYNYL